MTADEYYQLSRTKHKSNGIIDGLPARVYNALKPHYGVKASDGRFLELDWAKVEAAVRDGSIWGVRMLGEVGVKRVCEALAERDGQQ